MRFDPENPRDVVVAAGRSRLLTHPLDGLRSQLNASALAGVSPVSRDTAYRVFRDDPQHPNVTDAIVSAVGEAAHDPAWTGYHDAIRDALVAYQGEAGDDEGTVARGAVVAALQANFEAQFRSPGLPVSWMLQAAALTSSPAWEGEPPAEKQDLALGREILEQRRAFYQAANQQLAAFLAIVLSAQGRRPRPGVDPEHVVMLLHALLDGAVLRNVIEPGALPPGLVAEAMYALAEALTEEGTHVDPRRPVEDGQVGIFDGMLDAAEELWCSQPDVTVEEAAARAGVPAEAACLLFPTVGDLADSLLRARVVGGGFTDIGPLPDDVEVNQRLVGLVTELRNLRDFADECPHAVALTRTELPKESRPFVEDFVDNESRVIAALGAAHHPARFVRDLVGFASQGREAWPSVVALLRTLRYQGE
jgi:hypothetical protein